MSKLKEARKRRKFQIKMLKLCTCNFPIECIRNWSGHDPACPAHEYFITHTEIGTSKGKLEPTK